MATKAFKMNECPCKKCEFFSVKAYHEPCIHCSVMDWSKFKKRKAFQTPIHKKLFHFSDMPKHLCPVCGTALQEEGELKKLDDLSWYWDGIGVYACPSCGFESDSE